MKYLFLLTTFVASAVNANPICGYISQENEGTFLEVPLCNNPTTYEVKILKGAIAESLETGSAVCVSISQNNEIVALDSWDETTKNCAQ